MEFFTQTPIITFILLIVILIGAFGFTVLRNHGFSVQINDKRYYSMVITKYNRLFNLKGFINLIAEYKDDAEVHLYVRPVKEYSPAAEAEEEYKELQVIVTIPFRNSKEYRNFIKRARLEGRGVTVETCDFIYGTCITNKPNLYYQTIPTSLAVAFVKQCNEEHITCYLTEES